MNAVKNPLIGDTLYIDTHKTGLKIVVWPQPEASSVYAVFATKYGSVYNTLPTADGGTEEVPEGIAHYLEHKLFESEGEDAFTRYAATGANANAYTSFDRTAYLFHATENVLPSLEILLDFVQDPYFTEETVQKEQGIIGQEIRMGEDQPGRRVFFNLLEAAYHNHPVRIDIAGTVDTIARITPDLLYRCYRRYYNLHNMVLVVAGNITPDEVMATADRLLKPCEAFIPAEFAVEEPATVKQEYVEIAMPVASPLFYLGFKAPAHQVTATELAGSRLLLQLMAGRTSRLYNRLMDEGLVNDQFEDEYMCGPGYNMWLFGGESSDPKRVKEIICEEITRLQAQGLDAAEVEACRRGAYGRLVAGLDDPTECGELIQTNLIDGIEPLAELEALAKVTIEDLQAQLAGIDVTACALSVVNPL